MTDSTDEKSPAELGKNRQNPESMNARNDTTPAPAEQITDFESLYARHIRGSEYRVLSLGGDIPTAYVCDVDELTCDCPDTQYRTEQGDMRVCKHLAKALYQAPTTRDVGDDIVAELGRMHSQIADATRELSDAATTAESLLVNSRDATAGGTGGQPSPAEREPAGQSAAEAADKLQEAYDDVVDGMQVQHSEGYVWVQTGKDTPETLPGPGNVSVFDAFLKNADAVEYLHDDHSDVDMKPGEWWKNRIDPAEVDDYINEVLR
mgnify:FL=1